MKRLLSILILSTWIILLQAQTIPHDVSDQENHSSKNTELKLLQDSVFTYKYLSFVDSSLMGKSIYKYDENGNLILSISLLWNSYFNHFDSVTKSTLTYNTQNQREKTIHYKSAAGNTLIPERVIYDQYNSLGLKSERKYQYWDQTSNAWKDGRKFDYEYDQQSNIITLTESHQNNQDDSWEYYYRKENSYNNQNQELSILESVFDPSTESWNLTYTSEFTYNNSENTKTEIRYNVDAETMNLTPVRKVYEELLTEKYSTYRLTMKYQNATQSWQNETQHFSEYDENNQQTLLINYVWEENSGAWIGTYYNEYKFDENGYKVDIINKGWDPISSDWVNDHRLIRTLSDQALYQTEIHHIWNNLTEEWFPYDKTEYYKNQQDILYLSINYKQTEIDQWIINRKSFFYYTVISTESLSEFHDQNTPLTYPNPATDCIRFYTPLEQGELIEIYSMSGQLILMQPALKGQQQLELHGIPKGIYFIRIYNGVNIRSQKLLVE